MVGATNDAIVNSSAVFSAGATPGNIQVYPNQDSSVTGAGTEVSPYTSPDGTAGIQASHDNFTRAGCITLSASRFNISSPVIINKSSIKLRGVAIGANIDPNGESEGVNGTKLRGTSTNDIIQVYQTGGSASPRIQGLSFESMYFFGTGKNGYNSQSGINIVGNTSLDQAHFKDLNFGKIGTGIQVGIGGNAQLDTPYMTRLNALSCSFGVVIGGGGSIYGHMSHCCFADLDGSGIYYNPSGGYNKCYDITLVRCNGTGGSAMYPSAACTFVSIGNLLQDSHVESTGVSFLAGTHNVLGAADGVQLFGNGCEVRGTYFLTNQYGAAVHVGNNAVGCKIINCRFTGNYQDILIDSGSTDTVINCPGQLMNIVDNSGVRTIINGISTNAGDPNTTGNWNGVTKPNGLIIQDTVNSIYYLYINNTTRKVL